MKIIMGLLQDLSYFFKVQINLVPLSFYKDNTGLLFGWIEVGSGSSQASEMQTLANVLA